MAVNFRVSFLIKWKDQKRMENLKKNLEFMNQALTFARKVTKNLVKFPARVKEMAFIFALSLSFTAKTAFILI